MHDGTTSLCFSTTTLSTPALFRDFHSSTPLRPRSAPFLSFTLFLTWNMVKCPLRFHVFCLPFLKGLFAVVYFKSSGRICYFSFSSLAVGIINFLFLFTRPCTLRKPSELIDRRAFSLYAYIYIYIYMYICI